MAPESNTAIVVDSTSYLPEELIERHYIHRVSLYVTLDGEQKRESEIGAAEYDDFYERLRRSDGRRDHVAALGRRLPCGLRADPR